MKRQAYAKYTSAGTNKYLIVVNAFTNISEEVLSAKRQTKKEDTVNSTLNEKKPIIN
jgi:hypothetical protein